MEEEKSRWKEEELRKMMENVHGTEFSKDFKENSVLKMISDRCVEEVRQIDSGETRHTGGG